MKRTHHGIFLVFIGAILALAFGCASPARDVPMDFTAKATPAAAPSLSPSPTAAPRTPSPPPETPASTPAASHTPAASAEASPQTATAEAEADTGRVTLADGFYYVKLDAAVKKRITGISYPKSGKNLKITYDDLRYVRVCYYDFDGKAHADGELIVNKKVAGDVLNIFHELYEAKYPFTSIKLVDDYGEPGDDALSMAANNTSAFNYRNVSGTKSLSMHSYGEAIDINPRINPYVKENGSIVPANGKKYADRTLDFPGKIDHDDLCYKVFKKYGWSWGGDWKTSKDYQHFSKNGK